jgi:hypothetical protein
MAELNGARLEKHLYGPTFNGFPVCFPEMLRDLSSNGELAALAALTVWKGVDIQKSKMIRV